MAKYQNLRSAINFSEDEEEPIVADDNSAVDDALNGKMKKLLEDTDPVSARLEEQLGSLRAQQSQDEALNAGMKKLLGKTPTRAQAAANRALESMSKKSSISDDDLRAAYRPSGRPQMVGEMDLREPPKTAPSGPVEYGMDLRSPREVADQAEAGFSKKKDVIGESLDAAAFDAKVEEDTQQWMRNLRAAQNRAIRGPAEDSPALPISKTGPVEDPEFDAWLASIDKRPTRTEYNVNEDWNTPYPDKTSKPVIEDEHDVIIKRGNETWSNARGFIPKEEFDAMSPEDQAHYRKTHYQGVNGGWVKRDGEATEYSIDEETGLQLPAYLKMDAPVEDDGTAITPDGRVVSQDEFQRLIAERQAKRAGSPSPAKGSEQVVSASGASPASSAPEIPAPLLERLRAARAADAFDQGSSSLGRLLMATGAGFAKSPQAQALMQSYLQQQAKNEGKAFDNEKAMQKEEKVLRDEAEDNSTSSDVAMVGQNIARKLGWPEEQVKRITGKSAKTLIAILGAQTKLDVEDKKQTGNTERAKMNNASRERIAKLRSKDGKYAVDARKAVAMLRYRGAGPKGGDAKANAKFDAEVAKFVKSLPSGFGATLDNLNEIGNIIARNGGEVPGVGFFANFVPDDFVGTVYGSDAEELRALANNIYNEYIKGNYGSAFSATEERRFKAAMGSIKPGVSEDRLLYGLKEVSDLIGRKVEQGAAGYRDEVVGEAVKRGLPTIPNSRREVLRPPGQQASVAKRPLKMSGGKVYTRAANGDAVEVPLDQLTAEERQSLGV